MFTIEKANKILNIVLKEYPSLKDEIITIKQGNEFCVEMLLGNDITITNFKQDDSMKKYMVNYLKNNYGFTESDTMFYNFEETFSLIHEVGHIYYKDIVSEYEEKIHYSNFKSNTYKNHKEAFAEYRSIPTEKNADEFAITILQNRKAEIWALMQGITVNEAINEIEFWSM